MTLDEAIAVVEKKARDYRHFVEKYSGLMVTEWNETTADMYEQLAEWLKELQELRNFVRFVCGEVVDDAFKENADCFAEVVCRKLVKLGYVENKGDTYLDIVNVKKVDENNSRKRGEEE